MRKVSFWICYSSIISLLTSCNDATNNRFGRESGDVTTYSLRSKVTGTIKVNGETGPTSVEKGSVVKISWSSKQAKSCNFVYKNDDGRQVSIKKKNGKFDIKINKKKTFNLSCRDKDQATQKFELTVGLKGCTNKNAINYGAETSCVLSFEAYCKNKNVSNEIKKTVSSIKEIFQTKTCEDTVRAISNASDEIDLASNNITNVHPIAGMKPYLKSKGAASSISIDLSDNKIRNVKALAYLDAYINVRLENNPIGTSVEKTRNNCPKFKNANPSILRFCDTSYKKQKPNVIIIYTDDQAQEDIGAFGGKIGVETPNIDRLAKKGVKFSNFYAAAPICSPSRTALLTGKPPRIAEFNKNAGKNGPGLPLFNKTMAEYFKQAGYATHLVGKWHLGSIDKYRPTDRGFDSFYGHLSGCIDNYTYGNWRLGYKDVWFNRNPINENGTHFAELLMERAKRIVYKSRGPYFMYYAINQPHYPIQPLEHLVEKYKLRGSKDGDAHYNAFIETIDFMVGELLRDLEDSGTLENTIIIFQSDHGHSAESRNWDGIDEKKEASDVPYRINNPYSYSGAKSSLLEGGIKVPAIISWEKGLPANVNRDKFAVNIDWLPTLAELVGFSVDKDVEGKSLVENIKSNSKVHDIYFWEHAKSGWALRFGKWKLIKDAFDPYEKSTYDTYSLYNIEEDAAEANDLKAERPGILKMMLEKSKSYTDE